MIMIPTLIYLYISRMELNSKNETKKLKQKLKQTTPKKIIDKTIFYL